VYIEITGLKNYKKMRNREAVLKKLDMLETNINKLKSPIFRNNLENYGQVIDKIEDQISQLKTYIDSEPISDRELN
jgi:SMC interacting uncharacterized protein involved in chromosome segregation